MNPAAPGGLSLTARLHTGAADARRGIVRLHPEVLAALGLREWDAVALLGSRRTAAVAAIAPSGTPVGTALLDDVTLSNAGAREDADVVVSPVSVAGARTVSLRGSALIHRALSPATLKAALLGKVLTVGDAVSLLPRDLGPGTSAAGGTLAHAVGVTWTSELLTVVVTDPPGPVSVQPNSHLDWATSRAATPPAPSPIVDPARPATRAVADLAGAGPQAARLAEWLRLALDEPALLATLGAAPNLGVLVTGPPGVGKATLVHAVCAPRRVVDVDGPEVGALADAERVARVAEAVAAVRSVGGVLVIADVDALLPAAATPPPASTLVLAELRAAVATAGVALIATTSAPGGVDPRLRAPELCDRELVLSAPDAAVRRALLEMLLRGVPSDGLNLAEIASSTPGFVVADLAALVREAALRAAERVGASGAAPALTQPDLVGARALIRPLSRSATSEVDVGSVRLEDVGDMVATKQALTEAVLWPLRHPDTFARLGVEPPRGVLLYGPPGCGKTFLVRALAGTGELSVHAVKGAELLDKWVGSSERAVRDLFARARSSAPSLVFLDEIDALAPRRGQSTDSGTADRVVAALLTELDGIEPMRDVVVLGATNRPELVDPALLRPGRLERLVFVEPPDAAARADILRAASTSIPLADVDLDELAAGLDGYSAADCVALLREAALTAMRRSMDAAEVTAADVATAQAVVRPSLDPAQVAALRAFAGER